MAISSFIKKAIVMTVYVYRRYGEEGCAYRAAALAYTTLLSLVPLSMVVFALLSFIPEFQEVGRRMQDFIVRNFVPNSADLISQYLDELTHHVRNLSVVNVIFLGGVALLLMYNINRAFIAIWHTEHRFQLSVHFLIYSVILLLSPFVLGIVMLLGSFLGRSTGMVGLINLPYVEKLIFFVLPYILFFIVFTLFNWLLPSVKVKLLHAAIGGGVTTILFELAKVIFAAYLSLFPTYRILYGTLSVIPTFLLWLYVSWAIILLGAVVSNTVALGALQKHK